jgi:hypothetical protein
MPRMRSCSANADRYRIRERNCDFLRVTRKNKSVPDQYGHETLVEQSLPRSLLKESLIPLLLVENGTDVPGIVGVIAIFRQQS